MCLGFIVWGFVVFVWFGLSTCLLFLFLVVVVEGRVSVRARVQVLGEDRGVGGVREGVFVNVVSADSLRASLGSRRSRYVLRVD